MPRQLVGVKLGRSDAVPGRWQPNPDVWTGALGKGAGGLEERGDVVKHS